MAEIEFLTSYSQPNDLVVYAGAAPGTHIGLLADMFPFVRFLLVDPADFVCRPSARLDIHNGFFTDEMATQLAGRSDVLFISDIRSADWNHQSQAEVEAGVKQDMQNQMRWHLLMKPRVSLLKFRLPWEPGTCDYLDGTVYLPVWGPQTTTETRMVVSGSAMKRWDNVRYEQQMFYFNTVARVALYPHQVRADGIDHCFDCSSEVEILRQYVERMHPRWVFEMGQTDPAGLEADPVDFIILNAEYRQEDEDARASMPPPEVMQAAPVSADTNAGDGAPAAPSAAADAMDSASAAAGGDSTGTDSSGGIVLIGSQLSVRSLPSSSARNSAFGNSSSSSHSAFATACCTRRISPWSRLSLRDRCAPCPSVGSMATWVRPSGMRRA